MEDRDQKIRDLGYKVAIGTLFVVPAIMLLPPRKVDFYTFGLGMAWLYCLNHVAEPHDVKIYSPFRGNRPMLSKEEEEMRRRRAEEEKGMAISARMQKDLMEIWNADRKRDGEAREKRLLEEEAAGRPSVIKSIEELRMEDAKK